MTTELIIGLAFVVALFTFLAKESRLSLFVLVCLFAAGGYAFLYDEWRYSGEMTIVWLAGIAAAVFLLSNARELVTKLVNFIKSKANTRNAIIPKTKLIVFDASFFFAIAMLLVLGIAVVSSLNANEPRHQVEKQFDEEGNYVGSISASPVYRAPSR